MNGDDDRGFRTVRPGKPFRAPGSFVRIKRDSIARSGRRYTGNILNDSGTAGERVQFIIMNDVGTDDLVSSNEEVIAVKCPSQYESNSSFGPVSTYGTKYYAISICPWGALA